METRIVPAGTYLFKVGDLDDSIYVVQEGVISVFITDQVNIESIDNGFNSITC